MDQSFSLTYDSLSYALNNQTSEKLMAVSIDGEYLTEGEEYHKNDSVELSFKLEISEETDEKQRKIIQRYLLEKTKVYVRWIKDDKVISKYFRLTDCNIGNNTYQCADLSTPEEPGTYSLSVLLQLDDDIVRFEKKLETGPIEVINENPVGVSPHDEKDSSSWMLWKTRYLAKQRESLSVLLKYNEEGKNDDEENLIVLSFTDEDDAQLTYYASVYWEKPYYMFWVGADKRTVQWTDENGNEMQIPADGSQIKLPGMTNNSKAKITLNDYGTWTLIITAEDEQGQQDSVQSVYTVYHIWSAVGIYASVIILAFLLICLVIWLIKPRFARNQRLQAKVSYKEGEKLLEDTVEFNISVWGKRAFSLRLIEPEMRNILISRGIDTILHHIIIKPARNGVVIMNQTKGEVQLEHGAKRQKLAVDEQAAMRIGDMTITLSLVNSLITH